MVEQTEEKARNKRLFLTLLENNVLEANIDPNNFEVTSEFLSQILANDVNWFDAVINGIICVETNGRINRDSILKSKRSQQKLINQPLKGLRKVHLRALSIQSQARNLKLMSAFNLDKNAPQIVETDIKKLIYDYAKMSLQIKKKNTDQYENYLYSLLKYKNLNNLHTGDWLLYKQHDSKRYYLMIYEGNNHNPNEADEVVFNSLIDMYGQIYVERILKM